MKKLVVFGVVAASLALSACGVSASLNGAVASLGSSSNLQVHLTATASETGATASVAADEAMLKDFSADMRYSNPSGSALSSAGSAVDSEMLLNVNGAALIDLRAIGTNIYVQVNATALANVPGLNIPASDLAGVQLVVGGRWFEIPESLVTSLDHEAPAQSAKAKKSALLEKKIVDEIVSLIEKSPYTTLPSGGYSQSGTLASVVAAVWPTIASVLPGVSAPSAVPGTYALTLTMSGATVTGGSISITAPRGTGASGDSSQEATVTLNAAVTHANDVVVAPTGATVVTAGLLKQLGALAGASNSGGLDGL